ncbi:MAG TPA: tripartite tricarboxylate transporter substrate binding protein [Pseudolabrys sp.]|nr:tripartite tricarboxylate transporter substrate binding protein [Pseudolabrys sp.]
MKLKSIAGNFAAFGLFAFLFAAPPVRADDYPSRTIHVVVPFAAGGLNDNVIRTLQPYLSQKLKQTIVVENRSGASGIIGSEAVAKAAPDGYTLLVVASSHTVTPATRKHMPYDAVKSFAPVSLLMRDPLLFVVGKKVPAKTLADFVKLAKSEPGKLNYATPGSGSQAHFVTELFDMAAGIKMVEVPYRGGAPAVLSLVSGQTQFSALSQQLSVPHIKAGDLRALASGGSERSQQTPDVPTLAEAGYPKVDAMQWVGMLAPAGTPKPIIDKLNGVLRDVLGMAEVKSKFAKLGMTATSSTPEEFHKLLAEEVARWREVGRKAGIALH